MKKIFLIALVYAFCVQTGFGQNCSDEIGIAQKLYNNGEFNKAIEKIKNCVDKLESETVKDMDLLWRSYRLLTLNYISNNENDLARETAYKMLEINPTYKPSKLNDPVEFIRLINSITIIPKLSFGLALSFGSNLTIPKIGDSYFVAGSKKTYTGKNSFQFGVSTGYQFNKQWAVNLAATVVSKKYEVDYSFSEWDLLMKEKLTYLNFPLEIKYMAPVKWRFKPFIRAGGYAGFLILTDNSFYASYSQEGSYSLEHISSIDRRKKLDYGLCAGAGGYYKLGNGMITVNVNYLHSFQNITKTDTRNSHENLRFSYFYLDDDIQLRNLSVELGYSVILNYKVLKDKSI